MDQKAMEAEKAVAKARQNRLRAESERHQLVQRSSRHAKMKTQHDLASKRAKKVKTMDICFVVDLTASMQWWLQTVNAKMEEIIQDNLEHMGEFARVRVGFVGYRDYDDNIHPVVHPFTTEVGKIKTFLQNLEATGGGDACEDVLTGLEEALRLEWSATAKVLYLLSQTPHHGWRFHVNFEVSADHQTIKDVLASRESVEDAGSLPTEFYDVHAEDPRQWEPMDRAVQELQKKDIQMVILRLGSVTEKMFEVFKQQYRSTSGALKLQIYDARKDAKQLRCIVSSSSVSSYGSSISRMSQAKAIQGKCLDLPLDPSPPTWESAGWHKVDAQLYTYFMEDLDEPPRKTGRPFQALIAPAPFGKGAMRFAFYVVDELHPDRKCVGKVYQFADPVFQQKATYEGDMGSQAVASYLAKEFSLRYPESPIEFVQAQLLDLGDSSFPFRFMALEPWIPGKYEKKTSNAGQIAKDSDLAQAFSHFTWDRTEGDLMVADIQGVENTLTDPQIHSQDTDRFGRGNLCCKGMDAFFLNHVCNDICHTLRLQAHPHQPGSAPQEFSESLGAILETEENETAEETAKDGGSGADWMPLPNSKLSAFLDHVRADAKKSVTQELAETETCDCLGGAVFEWKDGPRIVEVKEGSPAQEAGCEDGVIVKLVGAKHVELMTRKEVLQLLAGEQNMIVGMASVPMVQSKLKAKQLDLDHLVEGLKVATHLLTALVGGSTASGLVSEGERLLEIEKILDKALSSEIELGGRHESAKTPGFDGQSGLETSRLGSLTVTWSDPPIVVSEKEGLHHPALYKVDGKPVFGLSKREIVELVEASGQPKCEKQMISVSKLCAVADRVDKSTLLKFLEPDTPVHPGVKCAGCSHDPVIGALFTCSTCAMQLCSACFKGRAHAHPPDHEFSVQDFLGSTSTMAAPPPSITEGSGVVVIGTGQNDRDGKLGVVKALTTSSSASPAWSVLIEGKTTLVDLEAKHLFLRPDQALETAKAAYEPPILQPPVEPNVTSARKPVPSRFSLVQTPSVEDEMPKIPRQKSLRELRQVEGVKALQRLKSCDPPSGRKSTFLCKGMCGTWVEKDKHEYIKEGQSVLCAGCAKKSHDSEEKITCGKCQKEFTYSKFLVDLGVLARPSVCVECQEESQWAIISPCP